MQLSEIFSQLTHGELTQISLGGAAAGQISQANYPAVVAHVNLGLMTLHKRFNLREEQVEIELVAGRTLYPLKKIYAVANSASVEPVKYIKDSMAKPFLEDVLKVDRVLTNKGVVMGLNNWADDYACSTPKLGTLQVPKLIVEQSSTLPPVLITPTLTLVYRANHPIIVVGGGFDPEDVEVDIPYSYLEPLLLFVASRVNNPMGMSGEFNAGNNYAAKFERACAQLENDGIDVDNAGQTGRLQQRGFP